MTVLDAYALIAALTEEPVPEVEALFSDETAPAQIAAVNLAEVVDVIVRVKKRGPDELTDRLRTLVRTAALRVIPVDEALARRAGLLRAEHYDRRTRIVSLADCVAAAAAESLREPLATPDPDLARVARDIGVAVIALRDSSGRRP